MAIFNPKIYIADFGPIYRALNRDFWKNCNISFRKLGRGVQGCLEFLQKIHPFLYRHLSLRAQNFCPSPNFRTTSATLPCVKSFVRQRGKVITKNGYHNDPSSFVRFFSQVRPHWFLEGLRSQWDEYQVERCEEIIDKQCDEFQGTHLVPCSPRHEPLTDRIRCHRPDLLWDHIQVKDLCSLHCTVISVNMPTTHFYRKYAHPFSEGSFLKILW